jgi:two-component system chemotaxis response regulator CheB
MFSMAEIYGAKNVGVVLTGMGSDGAKGIKAIKEQGGYTIAQDQATSVVYGMPFVAYQTGCVDKVVPIERVYRAILKACT